MHIVALAVLVLVHLLGCGPTDAVHLVTGEHAPTSAAAAAAASTVVGAVAGTLPVAVEQPGQEPGRHNAPHRPSHQRESHPRCDVGPAPPTAAVIAFWIALVLAPAPPPEIVPASVPLTPDGTNGRRGTGRETRCVLCVWRN
ncbi:hypothetical protein SAMN05444320_1146 [Streptoalloteichus hindustanus]|uniref:Secreted protein n=1 Tax=Streptoalloteichus hindustanus TaxID=2017 RepID=A0A1M5MPY5_STRHI|nr:hypothetical protein SAMN05444320_1146 [Streptoalloteichus hindustanus]